MTNSDTEKTLLLTRKEELRNELRKIRQIRWYAKKWYAAKYAQKRQIRWYAKKNYALNYAAKTGFLVRKEMVRSEVRSKTALFMVRQNY